VHAGKLATDLRVWTNAALGGTGCPQINVYIYIYYIHRKAPIYTLQAGSWGKYLTPQEAYCMSSILKIEAITFCETSVNGVSYRKITDYFVTPYSDNPLY
jgi:hypothetical protein